MALLTIRLFGRPRVATSTGPDSAAEIKLAHTGQTLLAYVLLRRDFSPRDVLASLCWAEQPEESARGCLNTALWRLRAALEPAPIRKGTYLQTTATGDVGFNWQSPHWLDLAEFEEVVCVALARPPADLSEAAAERLKLALDLYTGDLLEGLYDDWALRERERARSLYLDGLRHLLNGYAAQGLHAQAIAAGQRILRLDPLREDVHRDLIRLYAATGQRALAVRQYVTCREILAAELGIGPMEETEACYRQVVHEPAVSVPEQRLPPVRAVRRGSSDLAAALEEVAAARGQLQIAQERLREALQTIERFVPCT